METRVLKQKLSGRFETLKLFLAFKAAGDF